MNNIEYKKITICDIQHQDIYVVYQDIKGYYYDLSGNVINIEKYINHNTTQGHTNNNSYKIKAD